MRAWGLVGRASCVLAVLLAAGGCSHQVSSKEPSKPAIRPLIKDGAPVPDGSLDAVLPQRDPPIGVGDEIEVTVFRQEDMKRTLTVPPSQVIDFPMAGEVNVKGMTAADLRKMLTQRITPYVKEPQVSVRVTEARSQGFLVLGEVRAPGQFQSPAATSALQAITKAGGFTTGARKDVVLIRPQAGGKSDAYLLDLGRATKSGDLRANVTLASGDILYVPPSAAATADRIATHITTWLSPVIGVETAVIYGDEMKERFEGGAGSDIAITGQ
jgi:polysaccharide biosynthesis/export protein